MPINILLNFFSIFSSYFHHVFLNILCIAWNPPSCRIYAHVFLHTLPYHSYILLRVFEHVFLHTMLHILLNILLHVAFVYSISPQPLSLHPYTYISSSTLHMQLISCCIQFTYCPQVSLYRFPFKFSRFMLKHIQSLYQFIQTSSAVDKVKDWSEVESRLVVQMPLRLLSCVQLASKLSSHSKVNVFAMHNIYDCQ